jgi:hemolysin-activating ACP:hemolysin acyltransferase
MGKSMQEIGPDDWPAEEFHPIGNVCILEFNALYGRMRDVFSDLSRLFPEDTESVAYCRYKRGRAIYKRVSRKNRSPIHRPQEVEPSEDDQWLISSDESEGLRHSAAVEIELAIGIGMAAMILGQLPEYSAMPLSGVFNRIRNPIQRRQYRLYTSLSGNPVGFYSWAWIESDALRTPGVKGLSALELGDWSDGLELFLCDAVAAGEGLDRLWRDLCAGWFPTEKLYIYPDVDRYPAETLRVFDAREDGRPLPGAGARTSGAYDVARALIGSDT